MKSIKLTPTKDAYTALKADVDVHASVKELIDNIIDNAQRQGRETVTAELTIETDSNGAPVLVIRDDSGGLKFAELSMVFALGDSEKDDIEGSIGAFGIGAKKALMCLGNKFTIRSRHEQADTGYEYTVDPEWLDDDDEWEVPVTEADLKSGTTEIRIHNLNFSWPDLRDDLATDLSETYELHIRGDAPVTLRLLFPDEENKKTKPLTPPTRVSYSYTPWDGLFPRRYEGIILEPTEEITPVYMNVEVGLLVTGDESEAGIDWVCQHRVVERGNQNKVSGFGDVLPKFRQSKHKRLKGRVELYTKGDASELPWNSDKSRIHARHAVTEAARDVLKKVIGRYMKAGYGEVEPAFFKPYTADSRYAVNGGKMTEVSLKDRYQRQRRGDIQQVHIKEKPTDGLPEITDMQATAEAHAHLGIKYEYLDWVEPWMRPTYEALVEAKRKKFGCFDALESLETSPPDFTQGGRSGKSERERLTELARTHVNQGVRYTGCTDWEQPRYELELKAAADERDIAVNALEPVTELPDEEDPETDDSSDVERTRLTFAPFTEEELKIMRDHLGDLEEYSPDKRTEVLVEHFRRLKMAGVRFEAHAD